MVVIFTSREAAKADLWGPLALPKGQWGSRGLGGGGGARGRVCDQCFLRYRGGTQGGIWEVCAVGAMPWGSRCRTRGWQEPGLSAQARGAQKWLWAQCGIRLCLGKKKHTPVT